LLANNNEIISVGCNGLYSSYCVCMTSYKYNIDNKIKESICKECKFNRIKLTTYNNFKNILH
jgi:deoxycytidylate deaminase